MEVTLINLPQCDDGCVLFFDNIVVNNAKLTEKTELPLFESQLVVVLARFEGVPVFLKKLGDDFNGTPQFKPFPPPKLSSKQKEIACNVFREWLNG